ncbi:hypothetical protein [Bordetella genomosp. 9]|uniref:Uncharacterized protein n=1 Tax=Bordetella genomosp. 9 TaxID=1416803 RepID=A0A1W6Z241_9BORD|nr:hypothetical protein [Bordetella genomosp. 9]ARP87437.1 hypothetical protein CAL13_15375 [Bordetella genomosp. 9]
MDTGRDGRTVTHDGSLYQFRTVEQAAGFFRGIQEGKSVESCRQRWRPSMVRVAAGPGGAAGAAGGTALAEPGHRAAQRRISIAVSENAMDQNKPDQQPDSNAARGGMSQAERERHERSMPPSSTPSNEGPVRHRATRMDGNPSPVPSDDDSSGLKPRDDTPSVLPTKQGPRT